MFLVSEGRVRRRKPSSPKARDERDRGSLRLRARCLLCADCGRSSIRVRATVSIQGRLRQQGSGAIVNCSSLGGLVGGAERGIYHAAKHGVLGFRKSAALEYAARGIRINAICPGLIWTPMARPDGRSRSGRCSQGNGENVPMGRVGRPEEIANAVLWLCSDAASYVTG